MPRAFTLVELLVIVALISLLLGILLPSLGKSIRQARSAVCKSNLRDLYRALDMYQTDNNGWLPTVDSATAFRSADSWAARLFERNRAGIGVLICPDDPWAMVMRNSLIVDGLALTGNASYGLNDFIVSSPESFLANVSRHRPKRPDETILLADMGPDTIAASDGDAGDVSAPSRNYGRLAVDDGYRPGEPPGGTNRPWLTGRHMGRINVLTMQGNVKDVNILPAMSRPVESYYANCAAQYCTLCVDLVVPHYSFAESGAFWWTGSVPQR